MNKKFETWSGAWIFGSCCWPTSLELWCSKPCKWHWIVYRWQSLKDEVRNSLKFWTRRVHDSIVGERLISSSCAVVWRLKIGVMGESETWDGVWDCALCPRVPRQMEYWSGVRTLPSSDWWLDPLQIVATITGDDDESWNNGRWRPSKTLRAVTIWIHKH